MLKLQIISDAHLEFRKNPIFFKPSAPILCLLGDICACGSPPEFSIFLNFLKVISPKFQKIIHVAGNHEYYAGPRTGRRVENTYEGINGKLRSLNKIYPNYVFMSNNVHRLKVNGTPLWIIGTTLWSYIPPDKREDVNSIMNDYNMLYRMVDGKIRRWNVNDTVKYHSNSVKLIKRTTALAKKNNIKCILLTHHKPIMDGPKTSYQHCYESNLSHLIKHPIVFSAHGHTHKKYEKLINGVSVVSNPRGYPGEKTKFDPSFCVEISL